MAASNKPIVIAFGVVAAVAALFALNSRSTHDQTAPVPAGPRAPFAVDSSFAPNPVGRFFFLFDLSLSVTGTSGTGSLHSATVILPDIVSAVAGLDGIMPQEEIVGTIGSTSLRQSPLCRIPVKAPTLFTSSDTSWYRTKTKECAARVEGAAREKYTDIRGALDYAAQSIAGSRAAMRAIFVFSDLDEDLPPGQVAATPDLKGICVALFAIVTDSLAHHPEILRKRLTEWQRDATKWGARATQGWTTIGFDASEVQRFIRSCERK